jgi:hypothetical protein
MPVPTFLRWFLPAMFTGAFLSGAIATIVYKANRTLSVWLMALTSMAVGVGVSLSKRKRWAIPATHLLFAIFTIFALSQVLVLGVGAGAQDPQAFANAPKSTWGWIVWSVTNVRGVVPTLAPIALSLILGAWVPSYISLQGGRIREYFGLVVSEIAGRRLVVCISLCCLLPLYGFAIPVALYDEGDLLAAAAPFLQLLCSVDAWVGLALTAYGIRAGVELWSCSSGAVKSAKNLLAFRFTYSLTFAALLFIVAPNGAADYLLFGGGRYFFLTGIASGVLYVFLRGLRF